MDKNYKPVADYYRTKGYVIPSGTKNTAILKVIERDIAKLQGDVDTLKKDICFIKDYIVAKKLKEDNRWIF
tara:strand:- start:1347 stop:1559 length:213 start_codon:yes stop_codon:yes gene_type:complete